MRIEAALRWRETVAPGAEAYRLVHGEGDGLPSLVVDRYGDYLVDPDAVAGHGAREARDRRGARRAAEARRRSLERNDPKVRDARGPRADASRVLHGEVPERVASSEGDVRLAVDLRQRQKTGLFLDQRENHLAARRYARGRVLDAFCYDGGFALQVARDAE